jgi:hypothetical protein
MGRKQWHGPAPVAGYRFTELHDILSQFLRPPAREGLVDNIVIDFLIELFGRARRRPGRLGCQVRGSVYLQRPSRGSDDAIRKRSESIEAGCRTASSCSVSEPWACRLISYLPSLRQRPVPILGDLRAPPSACCGFKHAGERVRSQAAACPGCQASGTNALSERYCPMHRPRHPAPANKSR